jgi:Bacterial protein of unknown function (DUF853)
LGQHPEHERAEQPGFVEHVGELERADEPFARFVGSYGGQLYKKYAQGIDRESAHEMITARIAAARQAAVQIQAHAGETEPLEAKEAARQARANERAGRQAERARIAGEHARTRMLQTVVTAGTRLVTSQAGSDLIRGLLGTFFGGKR